MKFWRTFFIKGCEWICNYNTHRKYIHNEETACECGEAVIRGTQRDRCGGNERLCRLLKFHFAFQKSLQNNTASI